VLRENINVLLITQTLSTQVGEGANVSLVQCGALRGGVYSSDTLTVGVPRVLNVRAELFWHFWHCLTLRIWPLLSA
jgi:hypothetical protein